MKYATLLALLLVACSGSQSKKNMPDFPEANSDSESESTSGGTPTTHAPEQCQQSGEKIECLSDKDCCTGFYCGIDPEGSPRIKTCIYGGK